MKNKLLIALFASLTTSALFAAESPKVGSAAPEFSVSDSAGEKHSLADYKGKWVVLEWFNPQCPFVKKHYGSGNMQKLQDEYTGKGVAWLTIDSSAKGKEGYLTPDAAKQQIEEWKMKSSAVLLDVDGKTGQSYGAKNTPHMFIVNPEGKIAYEGAIDNKPTPNPADLGSATNYVKIALDEGLSGKPVTTPNTRPYGCQVKY